MPNLTRSALVPALVLLVAACSSGGATTSSGPPSSPPTGAPSTTPSTAPSPSIGAIDHATGPTDVLLRYDEGGGFVQPAFLATQAPIFTLYGDGTIVFRNPAADPPQPIGSVFPLRSVPHRQADRGPDPGSALLRPG